jgi:hypothetical protein
LRRRIRGYDRQQTDELLAQASADFDRLRDERDSLAQRLEVLQRLHEESALRVTELEVAVEDLERRLSEELTIARLAQQARRDKVTELEAILARREVRERALVTQLELLRSQPEQEPTHLLSRLDRIVESLEHEAREQAAAMLNKARRRAAEILRSAEARQQQQIESASMAAEPESAEKPELAQDLEQQIGEAMWTSRDASSHISE